MHSDELAAIEEMRRAAKTKPIVDAPNPNAWGGLFHSYDEALNAPELCFAIDGFLQEGGITMIGGLAGHGKTLVALSVVRALLTGEKLFGHFAVTKKSRRAVYLIPESSLTPFAERLKTFRLTDYIGKSLFFRTFSKDEEDIGISDPRILKACEGADVVLDTAVRFMDGDENAAVEQKVFAKSLFALLRAGARTVIGLHHAPKNFERENYMSLENILRGSGDVGAMLSACWGIRQVNQTTNEVFVQNVKARDFEPCQPFILEGRPWINQTGDFKMIGLPGLSGTLNDHKPRQRGERASGRPETADKAEKLGRMRTSHAEGKSNRQIAAQEGVDEKTVRLWLAEPVEAEVFG